MGIGVSIFLIAVGAILTFATNIDVSGVNLDIVGIILMVVGVIGLVMTLLVWGPRSRRVVEDRSVRGDAPLLRDERVERRDTY
jgi:hypothetical protein